MITVSEHVQKAVSKSNSSWFHRDEVEALIREYSHNYLTNIDQLENTPVLISEIEEDADKHLGAKL